MSDRDNWKNGQLRRLIFEVFDPITGDPVLGLTYTSFTTAGSTIVLLLEAVVPGTVPTVTVTELGAGRYKAEWTPNALGYWYFGIRHVAYNKQGWVDELNSISVAADDPVSVASASITAIATAVFTLPLSTYEAGITGVRCLGAALQRLRNKVAKTGPTTMTVYQSNGTTPAWTETIGTDASQQPVVSESPS